MQKGFVALPIVLGTLVIAGLVASYYYLNKPTPSILIKPVEENHLSTYVNEKLGFEFKYSKDLKVLKDSEEEFNKRGNGNFRKNFAYYVTYQPAAVLGIVAVLDKTNSFDKSPVTIWVFENPDNFSIEKWYANFWYYPFVWGDYTERRNNFAPINDATVSGQPAKYGIVNYQPSSPKFIYLSNSGKMYLFRIIGQQADQILYNFKFLE